MVGDCNYNYCWYLNDNDNLTHSNTDNIDDDIDELIAYGNISDGHTNDDGFIINENDAIMPMLMIVLYICLTKYVLIYKTFDIKENHYPNSASALPE